MTRHYSRYATKLAKRELDQLLAAPADVASYREAMTALGRGLGKAVEQHLGPRDRTIVAFSVEDADYLARGVLETLAQEHKPASISVACFWNDRIRIGKTVPVDQAPIIREYVEPHPARISALVMVKSVIGTACVVRTNLLKLLEQTMPRKILIVAPVMYHKARASLESEFPANIVDRFEYVYFARDTQLDGNLVVPGVGGSVYERLGLGTSRTKNRVRPELVTARRHLATLA
jgi:hypothetical protein